MTESRRPAPAEAAAPADEPTAEPTAGRWRSVRTVIALSWRADPTRTIVSLTLASTAGASQALNPWLFARVIDAALSGSTTAVVAWGSAQALLWGFGFVAAVLSLEVRFRMEEALTMAMDRDLIELASSIPGLEHHERPELLDKLDLLRQQRGMLSGAVGALVQSIIVAVSFVGICGVLATVHPVLMLLPVAGVPSLLASANTKRVWQRIEEETAEDGRLTDHLTEIATTAAPAKELRIFGHRDALDRRLRGIRTGMQHRFERTHVRNRLVSLAAWAVFAAAFAAATGFVAWRIVNGHGGPADMVLALSASRRVNETVQSTFWTVGWLFDSLKVVGRYLLLVDTAAAAAAPPEDPAPAPDRLYDGISLRSVSFQYPGTDRKVLADASLDIPAGTTVAVVGDNGAGKSTLMKLLCGFYAPTTGQVLVDGIDLARIAPTEWRARLAAGFQDFARFELEAGDAVGIGDMPWRGDRPRIGSALERAAATDVVSTLPAGLDSMLGKRFEGGTELSGGQWQKLALARAMMRERPLLLILDEPTAALDADTEHALFERYAGAARIAAERTGGITVLVSHRFSTVRMADVIVVLDDNRVAEVGTHSELIALGGLYAELFELQARAYR